MPLQWRLRRALHAIASRDDFVTILVRGMRLKHAILWDRVVWVTQITKLAREMRLKVFNKTSRGGAARTASHDIGAIYAIENDIFSTNFKRDFPSAASHVIGSLAPDIVGKSRLQKIAIAFLAPISWLGPLATSPKLGRLQKAFDRISRAKIVTSATRNITKRWLTSKNFNRISRANIVTSAIRNISKRWSTSKNFNCISRANIVTSATRNISKAWSTKFQSHFSRQYRD